MHAGRRPELIFFGPAGNHIWKGIKKDPAIKAWDTDVIAWELRKKQLICSWLDGAIERIPPRPAGVFLQAVAEPPADQVALSASSGTPLELAEDVVVCWVCFGCSGSEVGAGSEF